MYKKSSLVLIFSLVVVQAFSMLHMAEHGFEKHEHQGQICDIYLYHQYQQQLDNNFWILVLQEQGYVAFICQQQVNSFIAFYQISMTQPRAPPILS